MNRYAYSTYERPRFLTVDDYIPDIGKRIRLEQKTWDEYRLTSIGYGMPLWEQVSNMQGTIKSRRAAFYDIVMDNGDTLSMMSKFFTVVP